MHKEHLQQCLQHRMPAAVAIIIIFIIVKVEEGLNSSFQVLFPRTWEPSITGVEWSGLSAASRQDLVKTIQDKAF